MKILIFWGCFATPATLDFGSLCGPCDQLKTYAFFHPTYLDITSLLLLNYLDICINVIKLKQIIHFGLTIKKPLNYWIIQ